MCESFVLFLWIYYYFVVVVSSCSDLLYFKIILIIILDVCLYSSKSEKKSVDLDGWGGGEDLGRARGEKTIIRINRTKISIFNENK